MMYGYGMSGGWWILGMGMMVIFLIAIIQLVMWVVRRSFPSQMNSGRNRALEKLQQRYASGEITVAEYEQARATVEQTPVA